MVTVYGGKRRYERWISKDIASEKGGLRGDWELSAGLGGLRVGGNIATHGLSRVLRWCVPAVGCFKPKNETFCSLYRFIYFLY